MAMTFAVGEVRRMIGIAGLGGKDLSGRTGPIGEQLRQLKFSCTSRSDNARWGKTTRSQGAVRPSSESVRVALAGASRWNRPALTSLIWERGRLGRPYPPPLTWTLPPAFQRLGAQKFNRLQKRIQFGQLIINAGRLIMGGTFPSAYNLHGKRQRLSVDRHNRITRKS